MKTCFLNDLIADRHPVHVYTGLEEGCRCGCHGSYFEPGTVGFARALNKAKKLNPIVQTFAKLEAGNELNAAIAEQTNNEYDGIVRAVAAIASDESWVDISLGNGKTITIYYK